MTGAKRVAEALLFAAREPLSAAELGGRLPEGVDVAALLAELAGEYRGRGFELVERGGRWHFQTAADLGGYLTAERVDARPLSRAAMETLAIIAYHEPVTRAEVEDIRGVAVAPGSLDVLMRAGWVRPAGRRESPGRPVQYATTGAFLAHFGLASRRDLPGIAELRAAGLLSAALPEEPGLL